MSRLNILFERVTRPTLWLAILLILTFLLYLPGVDAPYIGDDFILTFDEPLPNLLYYFYTPHDLMVHYRPIQLTLSNLLNYNFPSTTVPFHLIHFFSHGLLGFVTYLMLQNFGLSRLQAVIASLYLVLSHTEVAG